MHILSRPVRPASLLTRAIVLLLTALQGTTAQQTEAFTDPETGITFQRFFGAKTSFGFGIALPQNPSTDFIGRFDVPMPGGAGWAGVSLQEDMVDPLLIVAWPSGGKVVTSFRVAANEDDSPPVVDGKFAIKQIPAGTAVNDTFMTFTFLCQNCLDNGEKSFAPQDTSGTFGMGWALADESVSDPADPAAILPFHNVGFDEFDAILSAARSPLFGEWAQLAGATVISNGSTTAIPIDPPGTVTGGDGGADDDSGDEAGDDGGVDSGDEGAESDDED